MSWNDGRCGAALEFSGSDARRLCLMAGPGTGKTFALVRRVARLLEQGADPSRILLVTFTRLAANDLEKELRPLNTPGVDRVRKGTLHSYCFAALQQSHVLGFIGRVPRPVLRFEERFLLEDVQDDDFGDYYSRRERLGALGEAWAREQDQEPGWPPDETDRRFAWAVDGWLRFHEAIHLNELIPLTLRYLRGNPGCRELQRFKHVLVDEYQDLNRAEQSLIDLLSQRGSAAVVGDEDQSVYETFRCAHPEGLSGYAEPHSLEPITLDESRRCPTLVVEMANELIRYNVQRTGRTLSTRAGNYEGDISVVQWQNMQQEAAGIAAFIYGRISAGEFDPGETLVLCPRRQFGFLIRDALRERGCVVQSFFHEGLLEGNPKKLNDCRAQQALTLLTLLARPADRVALRCWLGFGSATLARAEYARLREYCSRQAPPRDALEEMVAGSLSIPHTRHIKTRYSQLAQLRLRFAGAPAREVVNALFPEGDEWAEPFRRIAQQCGEGFTLDDVLDALRTSVTQPELPSDVDFVRVMSLHKAKGLNEDHLVVAGCVEGLIPTRVSRLPPDKLRRPVEEQRRLLYVAITHPRAFQCLESSKGPGVRNECQSKRRRRAERRHHELYPAFRAGTLLPNSGARGGMGIPIFGGPPGRGACRAAVGSHHS